jgi:NAD-dependent dihydropyrimidine dehydrogenase PreA subunit
MDKKADCKQPAGLFSPVIDRNKCEGKGDCVQVCPESVFVIGTLPVEMRSGLGVKGRIKGFAHRWQQALLVNSEACKACGLCVTSCPESAIELARA